MPSSPHLPPRPLLTEAELVDLRAAQRTYQGAWLRTSLANLGYAAVVLKVFDRRFFSIGILYTLLSLALLVAGLRRSSKAKRALLPPGSSILTTRPPTSPFTRLGRLKEARTALSAGADPGREIDVARRECGEEDGGRRLFETAGPVVLVFGAIVAGLEVALLVLVLRF